METDYKALFKMEQLLDVYFKMQHRWFCVIRLLNMGQVSGIAIRKL